MRNDGNNKKTFMNIRSWKELCSNYAELYSLLVEPHRLPNPSFVWLIYIGSHFQSYMK